MDAAFAAAGNSTPEPLPADYAPKQRHIDCQEKFQQGIVDLTSNSDTLTSEVRAVTSAFAVSPRSKKLKTGSLITTEIASLIKEIELIEKFNSGKGRSQISTAAQTERINELLSMRVQLWASSDDESKDGGKPTSKSQRAKRSTRGSKKKDEDQKPRAKPSAIDLTEDQEEDRKPRAKPSAKDTADGHKIGDDGTGSDVLNEESC